MECDGNRNGLAILVAYGALPGLTDVQAKGNSPENCEFKLKTGKAEAKVIIKRNKLEVEFKKASPNRLYTVWIDYKNRATKSLADDYPSVGLDVSGPGETRGVAPTFATTQGVTSGMGLDANGIITEKKGNGKLEIILDYNLLEAGASPVVAADLVNQGANRVGDGWLRVYQKKLDDGASNQVIDRATGLPKIVRATAQDITIVSHPNDSITHGHTPLTP